MKKLNMRGVAHEVLLVVVVVVVAVAGVGYLVASHADSCNPVSGAVSGAASVAVSGAACNTTISCVIVGAPAFISPQQYLGPKLVITNNGKKTAHFTMYADSLVNFGNGKTKKITSSRYTQALGAHHTSTHVFNHVYQVSAYGLKPDGTNYVAQGFIFRASLIGHTAVPNCLSVSSLPSIK